MQKSKSSHWEVLYVNSTIQFTFQIKINKNEKNNLHKCRIYFLKSLDAHYTIISQALATKAIVNAVNNLIGFTISVRAQVGFCG